MKPRKRCGNCCWMKYANSNEEGICVKGGSKVSCNYARCFRYISIKQARHYIAVLMLHQRWRRSNEPCGTYRMQDPIEIGKALDFVIEYTKTFMNL